MKTQLRSRQKEAGSVLMIALVMAGIIGFSMISYFLLMNHQNRMVFRGQAWNHALTLAEAGVEEALAHINLNFGTNNPIGYDSLHPSDGWSGPTAGPGTLTAPRQLAGGSYTVTISSGLPIITSTGRVPVPNSSQFVERTVRAYCVVKPAREVPVVARKNIDFKGNKISVDSYDSSSSAYSTGGLYDEAKRKAGGDVASTEGFISVGNADIKGKLYTGPLNSGQYSVGPQGSVGDLNWTGPGIQPGWYFNDFNQTYPSVGVPYTIGLPLPSKTNSTYVLSGANSYYISGDLAAKKDTIIVKGNVAVYVTGSVNISQITIDSGASMKLYVGGASAIMDKVNTAGNAVSFSYFGLPGNTSVTWSGNDQYLGTIYAPQASIKLGGGGNNDLDYQGSLVVESLELNGHFSIHYDEALKKLGAAGWVVSKWDEI